MLLCHGPIEVKTILLCKLLFDRKDGHNECTTRIGMEWNDIISNGMEWSIKKIAAGAKSKWKQDCIKSTNRGWGRRFDPSIHPMHGE